MPLTPDALPDFAANLGKSLVIDNYNPATALYPMLGRQLPPGSLSDPMAGHRQVGVVYANRPRRRRPGQEPVAVSGVQGYTRQLAYSEWSIRIPITYELLQRAGERGVTTLMEQSIPAFASGAVRQKEEQVFGMLQKGTLSAGSVAYFDQQYDGVEDANIGKIYDGKPLFAASGNAHPFKNHTATGSQGVNLTVSNALNASNLDAAVAAMQITNAIDENGDQITIQPRYLVVPPALRSTAHTLLNSQLLPGSANNDVNPVAGIVGMIMSPYLTDDTDAWFLVDPANGFVFADSGAPAVRVVDDPLRKITNVVVEYNFGAAPFDWRGLSAHNKAAS